MPIPPPRTARFEAFVAPVRAHPALWRLAAGALIAAALWFGAALALLPLAGYGAEPAGNRILVLYLYSFAGLLLGVWLAARFLQRRSLSSLIGPAGFRPRRFALGLGVAALVGLVGALPLVALAPPVRQLPLATWAGWLPLALPGLLVQTAAEELAFRGYLMQGLGARFRSPLAWWLAPALLFGLLHLNPGVFGANAWLAVASATILGLILADVTARTGDLSLAMGLHFANNVSAILIVAIPSPLAGLGLWLAGVDPADTPTLRALILADLATTLAAYAIWLAARSRWRRN